MLDNISRLSSVCGFGLMRNRNILLIVVVFFFSACAGKAVKFPEDWTKEELFNYMVTNYKRPAVGLADFRPVRGDDIFLVIEAVRFLEQFEKKECRNFKIQDHLYFFRYTENTQEIVIVPAFAPDPGNRSGISQNDDGTQQVKQVLIDGARQLGECEIKLETQDEGMTFRVQ